MPQFCTSLWHETTRQVHFCSSAIASVIVEPRIWSIAHLTKRTVQLGNLSTAQNFTNCTIFGQSCSALAMGLGSGLGLGFGLWFGLVLELGLDLRNWPNVQRV